jgi:hypothetical protein
MTKDIRDFDYAEVARLDSDMWRAYYAHHFFKLFLLLIKTLRTQFQFGLLLSLRAAYYAGHAAADYRLHIRRENFARIERKLTKFYKLLSDRSTRPFDYQKAATIELEWWNIHRYPKRYAKTLERSLAEEAAIIYGGDPEDFMEYGRYRTEAMDARDAAGNQKTEPDWKKIEKLLVESWRALHAAANSKRS